jgi:bilirubin oxidase
MSKLKTIFITMLLPIIGIAQNQLLIPDTLSGTSISLNLQNGTHQFFAGQATNTIGANGSILGPTLLLSKGDYVNFSVNNQLADTTTIHWHGLHVSPENDGGPHTYILPNSTWTPSFTIMDKAATYWYHPHLHHKTNEHVSKGLAGMILVRDSTEAQLSLPRNYGIDDIPLVIQTKDFDNNNQIVVHSNSDDNVMVNATINPYIELPAQVIRLRVLNGSSQRAFNLGLSNNQVFYQIASDGGLLSSPYQITRLLLAPGERAELLINLSGMNGQSIYLKSFASELPNGIYGATNPGMGAGMSLTGYNPNPLNGNDFNILNIDILSPNSNPITTIPSSLATVTPWNSSTASTTRTLTFTPQSMGMNQLNGKFLINNTSFNMGIVNYTIPLDNVEIWEIFNQSGIAHPFHIHDVQFNILSRNGNTPAPSEQGWKDVVLVKPMETVRFITKFEDFANDSVPYMYHCHLLTHEDDGMMGQFIVKNTTTSINDTASKPFVLYPNPTNDIIHISGLGLGEIYLYNVQGQLINYKIISKDQVDVDISQYSQGIYFLTIISNDNKHTYQIVKQ